MVLTDQEPSIDVSSKLTQPRAEYMDLTELRKDKDKTQGAYQDTDDAALHPSKRSWEVERDHLRIEKINGKGAFGQVAKERKKELDTIKQLKPHPRVIKLLGCVTEFGELVQLFAFAVEKRVCSVLCHKGKNSRIKGKVARLLRFSTNKALQYSFLILNRSLPFCFKFVEII